MALRRVAVLACAGASVHRTVPAQRLPGRNRDGSASRLRLHLRESNRRSGRRRAGARPGCPLAVPGLSHRPHGRFLAHRTLTRRTLGAHADSLVQARRRPPVPCTDLRRREAWVACDAAHGWRAARRGQRHAGPSRRKRDCPCRSGRDCSTDRRPQAPGPVEAGPSGHPASASTSRRPRSTKRRTRSSAEAASPGRTTSAAPTAPPSSRRAPRPRRWRAPSDTQDADGGRGAQPYAELWRRRVRARVLNAACC